MVKKSLRVEGMTCAMCAKTIEKTFEAMPDIKAEAIVSANKVIMTYDEQHYSLESIAKTIKSLGYTPILKDYLEDNKKIRMAMKVELIVSIVLSLPLLWAMFSHIQLTSFIKAPALFTNGIFQLVVAGLIQFGIGRRFFKGAFVSIQKKSLGMDILVVLGTTSAYLYSLYLLIEYYRTQSTMHPVYYFEVSALIITMVLIGNFIEHIAKEKTEDALVDLINLGAKEARVLRDGEEMMITIEDVVVGDQVVVLANEKIPVDGKIIAGQSHIDESMITGESMPVYKKENDFAVGGTINLQEKIMIEATNLGEDALLNQIIASVEEASARKIPIQRTADKIASVFVPGVVIIALVNFFVHLVALGDGFTYSFTTTIAILVISCPCALGLATPTSILVGNGLAAKHQILYKGGEFFEIANKITAIAFDKTGTITHGKFEITDFVGEEEYLDIIYSIEKESTHPISKAVSEYAKEHGAKAVTISNFEAIKGKGLRAMIGTQKVLIGSAKIIDDFEIDINGYQDIYNQLQEEAKTVNFLVIDCEIKALYALRDEIKDTSKQAIAELKKRGITTYLVSGDNKGVTERIAYEVGVDHMCCEVLPTEKAEIVEEIQKQNHITAFVGDGINDAPALKQADIGIAMGQGTDIAIHSSDLTLMSGDLRLVIEAIDLSKATLKNIHQNFLWAFSYNLVAIPLAASGHLSMALAGAAMAFSSIMVVLNALRLKRFQFRYTKGDTK
ncbi:MAG: copper-translocating P-type ATPase [Bacilli bacterium]|nr:copper-translocating P-type ATPase [Bacilli bacterium]MBN2876886.1 copper-translocating P-type ATPase [Bacilli bacterium]